MGENKSLLRQVPPTEGARHPAPLVHTRLQPAPGEPSYSKRHSERQQSKVSAQGRDAVRVREGSTGLTSVTSTAAGQESRTGPATHPPLRSSSPTHGINPEPRGSTSRHVCWQGRRGEHCWAGCQGEATNSCGAQITVRFAETVSCQGSNRSPSASVQGTGSHRCSHVQLCMGHPPTHNRAGPASVSAAPAQPLPHCD